MSLQDYMNDALNPSGAASGYAANKAGVGGVVGDFMSGNYQGAGSDISNAFSNKKGQSAAAAQQQSIQQQQGAEQGVLNNEQQQGSDYFNTQSQIGKNYENATGNNVNGYVNNLSAEQAKYDPGFQQLSDTATGNAKNAMSLQQAMDPNNAVASATRSMYGNAATGIQNQGLADYGVLAALGGQATANTIGASGQPMTGGMAEAIQGSNMQGASNAFTNAQNTANNLNIEGLQAGQQQSNWAYGQGQQAQGQAAQALSNQYNFNQGIHNDIFGAQQGQAATNYGIDTGIEGLGYQVQQQGDNNQMGMINQVYGAQQQADVAQAQAANASTQGLYGALGSLGGGLLGYAAGGGFGGAGAGGGQAAGTNAAPGGWAGGNMQPSPMQSAGSGAQIGGQVATGLAQSNMAPTTPPGGYYQPGASYGSYGPYGRAA